MQIPKLREWRERRGLTQKDLARIAKVSPRSVAGYEAGQNIRPNTARKIADALEIAVEDLLNTGGEYELDEREKSRPKARRSSPEAPEEQASEERREDLRLIRELLTDTHGLFEDLADEYKAAGANDKLTTLANAAMFCAIGAEQFVKDEVGPAQDRASTRVYAAGSRLEEFIEDLLETIQSTTTEPVVEEVAYLDAHRRRRAS